MTHLALAAGLALLLSAQAALAGSISLTIRANAVAEAGQLIVSLEIENRGDEPAHAVVPALELVGETVRGEVSDQIEPGHLVEERLAVVMPSNRTGRWPYAVFVDYTDRNGYPAQAVHIGLASVGDPPPPRSRQNGCRSLQSSAKPRRASSLVTSTIPRGSRAFA